nr:MAG TPA: hypothetical protein [Bacteriophage sp.]
MLIDLIVYLAILDLCLRLKYLAKCSNNFIM